MRCLALFSGGLDSQLAVALLRQQAVEVVAVHFYSPLDDHRPVAEKAAASLHLPLTVLEATEEYFDLIRRPKFGYTAGAAPGIDWRIYWFRRAAELMAETEAALVISGEVLGQRLPTQTRRVFEIVAHHAGLEGRLLRPLSAQLLNPTCAEESGRIDRDRLLALQGRGRKAQLQLAAQLGIEPIPPLPEPSLSDGHLATKACDLMQHQATTTRWDFELLPCGRHFRLDSAARLVVARNREESLRLESAFAAAADRPLALLVPENFVGPSGLLIGIVSAERASVAAALVRRFGKNPLNSLSQVAMHRPGCPPELIAAAESPEADKAVTIDAPRG